MNELSSAELSALAKSVEAHLSPQYRAQLLEADVALSNALRELVDTERAKMKTSQLQSFELGALRIRSTLYPDKIPRAGRDPSYIGTVTLAGKNVTIRAWIAQNFINLELSLP